MVSTLRSLLSVVEYRWRRITSTQESPPLTATLPESFPVMPFSSRAYHVVQFFATTLLLVAAGLKARQLSSQPLSGSGLFASRWFLISVVEMEIFFGLWLAIDLCYVRFMGNTSAQGPTWLATLSLFSAFAFVALWKALSGQASCGCFGNVEVNPWYTTTLDVLIVLLLISLRPRKRLIPPWADLRLLLTRLGAVLAVWLIVGGAVGYATSSYTDTTLSTLGEIVGDGKIVVLEPENWVGKRLPLLNFIDAPDALMEGKWLVLLYHHDCPKCREVIRNLHRTARKLAVSQVVLIELPPYGGYPEPSFPSEVKIIHTQLRGAHEWFVESPAAVLLKRGIVIGFRGDGDLLGST
jgi:hypothetical protein